MAALFVGQAALTGDDSGVVGAVLACALMVGAAAGPRCSVPLGATPRSLAFMTADDFANQAAEVAARMKPGTWDAVQALALVSIAQSLAEIARSQGSAG
jgi:hypothetical protein